MSKYDNINQIIRLENDKINVEILPELGGKISVFTLKDKYFNVAAENDKRDYFLPKKDTLFEESDASGFDDTFPNIDAGSIMYNGRKIEYHDHGEIWKNKFDVIQRTNDMIKMEFVSDEYKYKYEKTISILGNVMTMNICIKKLDKEELPCFWTFHDLTTYREDMKLLYPQEVKKLLNVCESNELGEPCKVYNINSDEYNFHGVPNRESNTAMKYYVDGKIDKGYCGYEYPSEGVKFEMKYDTKKLPYLGFWLTAGKYRGDYNCAFEPSNGFYDSMETAMKNNKFFILSEKNKLEFEIKLKLSRI